MREDEFEIPFYLVWEDEHGVLCVEPLDTEERSWTFETVSEMSQWYTNSGVFYFTLDQFTEGFQKPAGDRYVVQGTSFKDRELWLVVDTHDDRTVAELHGGDAERLIRKVCDALNDGWNKPE